MLSTINVSKSKYNLPSNDILPRELMEVVFDFTDSCSSIYNKEKNAIVKYDFNTLEKISEIKYTDFIWRRFSVSPCDIFIVVSHYAPCFVSIYNQQEESFVNILLLSYEHEIYTTFIPNGDLLIAQKNCIYHYRLGSDNNWTCIYTYNIPDESRSIEYITHNSIDMFVCYGCIGDIYIFNFNTHELIHTFTEIKTMCNIDICNIIQSIDFKKNKLIIYIDSFGPKYIYIDLEIKTVDILEEKKLFGNLNKQKILFTPCLKKVIGHSLDEKSIFVWDLLTKKIIQKASVDIDNMSVFTPGGLQLISEYENKIKIINWSQIVRSLQDIG